MILCICASCQSVVISPAAYAGRSVRCPNCNQEIIVPVHQATEKDIHESLRRVAGHGKTGAVAEPNTEAPADESQASPGGKDTDNKGDTQP